MKKRNKHDELMAFFKRADNDPHLNGEDGNLSHAGLLTMILRAADAEAEWASDYEDTLLFSLKKMLALRWITPILAIDRKKVPLEFSLNRIQRACFIGIE